MKNKGDKYEELGLRLWNKFDNKLEELGFKIITHNDDMQGKGTIAFNQQDNFVPIFRLIYWYSGLEKLKYDKCFFNIFIEDRNGNKILTGNTIAFYILDLKEEDNFNEIETRFEKMLELAIKNYSIYSKNNRLDSAYKALKEDRQNF